MHTRFEIHTHTMCSEWSACVGEAAVTLPPKHAVETRLPDAPFQKYPAPILRVNRCRAHKRITMLLLLLLRAALISYKRLPLSLSHTWRLPTASYHRRIHTDCLLVLQLLFAAAGPWIQARTLLGTAAWNSISGKRGWSARTGQSHGCASRLWYIFQGSAVSSQASAVAPFEAQQTSKMGALLLGRRRARAPVSKSRAIAEVLRSGPRQDGELD
jgi:hypothetical protein